MIARLRLLILAAILSSLVLAIFAAPAGAYYGEVEGYRSFSGGYAGSSTQGCHEQLFVLYGMRVQPYCYFHNGLSDVYVGKTNYYEYSCWSWDGCTYDIFISSMGAPWHPLGCYHLKKDDYSGQHAIIMSCYPAIW